MYLVLRLKEKLNTNAGSVDLTTEGLCGMMPVFKDRQEAINFATSEEPYAQVPSRRSLISDRLLGSLILNKSPTSNLDG